MNPFLRLMSKGPLFTGIDKMEDELLSREDTLHSTAESPIRFEIIREGKKRGKGGPPKRLITIMLPILFGIRKTLLSLKDNPTFPNAPVNSTFIILISNFYIVVYICRNIFLLYI